MRTSIPNPIGGGIIGAHRFNQLCETAEGATYRGKGHKTTRGVIPRIQNVRQAVNIPTTIVIDGTRLTITGTPSRYIKFRLDGTAAEWSSVEVSPWPSDGSVGYIDTQRNEPVILTQ